MHKYKTIFVLGAGFSRSFCPDMPVISALTEELFDDTGDDEFRDLRRFALDFYEGSSRQNSVRNLENIATILLSQRVFLRNSDLLEFDKLRHQLLRFIFEKTRIHSVEDKASKRTLSDFLLHCWSRPDREEYYGRTLIATFNYDLLIERMIEDSPELKNVIHLEYGIHLMRYPSFYVQESSASPFEFLKLHGSLNWFHAKGSSRNDMNSIYVVDEDDSHYPIHKDDTPVFIPMAHSKESFLEGTLFASIWSKLGAYLDDAAEIVFIGYGFPQTDLSNLYLFLKYKEKIRHVIVYDDDSFSRLTKVFGTVVAKVDAMEFISEICAKDGLRRHT